MRILVSLLMLYLLQVVYLNKSNAQCPVFAPAALVAPACPVPGGTALSGFTNPYNQAGGVYFTNTSIATTASLIYIDGGTLVICSGTWSLSNSYLALGYKNGVNSTTPVNIIVKNGATLSLVNSQLYIYGAVNFTNYGTVAVSGSSFEFVAGYTGSCFNNFGTFMDNGAVVVAGTNSGIVNKGSFSATGIIYANSSPYTCLGAGSAVNVGNLANSGNNHPFFSSTGNVCVKMSGSYTANGSGNTVSASPDVKLCISSGNTPPNSADLGAAVAYPNCLDCAIALPVEIKKITAQAYGANVLIGFTVGRSRENRFYLIERSSDGLQFEIIARLEATQDESYRYTDLTPGAGDRYYRLRVGGTDGTTSVSAISRVQIRQAADQIRCVPNPARDQVLLLGLREQATARLFNGVGQLLATFSLPAGQQPVIDIAAYTSGYYILSVETVKGSQFLRFVK